MAKKTTPPAAAAAVCNIVMEFIETAKKSSGKPLTDEDRAIVVMAVAATQAELGVQADISAAVPDAIIKACDQMIAGAREIIDPFDKVSDRYLEELIGDQSHSESSIVTIDNAGILTKPLARMILSFRRAIASFPES